MLDSNMIQPRRSKPYKDRSGPSLRRLRTDLSVYEVVELQRRLISQSIHYLLSIALYRKRNSRWIKYPCCSPIASAIDVVDIGTISTIDIGTTGSTTSISCADVSSCR
ncbi:hypothetical protein BYT27DRAFT_6339761 [Phlegmacium glaucopus]|nr:hypothetical protein BYT27DRAFT_6339761 [Phlegmacium glaucopus]